MKYISMLLIACCISIGVNAQTSKLSDTPDPTKPVLTVKAACGKCLFGMKADECTLAVRIKGKTYFVEGTGIDDYGDAHAKNGFCNATCNAEVQGEIRDGKFYATYFKLVKDKPKTN